MWYISIVLIFDNRIRLRTGQAVPVAGAIGPGDIFDGETVGELCRRLADKSISEKEIINGIGRLIGAGAIEIEWKARSDKLALVTGGGREARRLCSIRPYLWNVLTYETEWNVFPEYNDFLEPGCPVHEKKKFQWEIYESLMAEELRELALGARVLDLGGGVGRAAVQLAARGCDVTVVDASPRALSSAWKHLSRVNSGGFDLAWGDIAELDFLPEKSFDAVLALEVFCYHGSPRKAIKEAVRRVEPGGWLAFSVENKAGAILSDPSLRRTDVIRMLNNRRVIIEGDLYVEYFGRKELESMALESGMSDVRVSGCHFLADGPFGKFLKEKHYRDAGSRKRMQASEQFLRNVPAAGQLGRAWFVIGRVD